MERPLASGWSCAVCGANVDLSEALSWRCPNATDVDRHHSLQLVQGIAPLRGGDDPNPFVAFRPYLAWDSFAAAHGTTDVARTAMVRQLDADIASIAGVGFHVTPFERAEPRMRVLAPMLNLVDPVEHHEADDVRDARRRPHEQHGRPNE